MGGWHKEESFSDYTVLYTLCLLGFVHKWASIPDEIFCFGDVLS